MKRLILLTALLSLTVAPTAFARVGDAQREMKTNDAIVQIGFAALNGDTFRDGGEIAVHNNPCRKRKTPWQCTLVVTHKGGGLPAERCTAFVLIFRHGYRSLSGRSSCPDEWLPYH